MISGTNRDGETQMKSSLTAYLLLIHASEHIQSQCFAFTNLTPENKGKQEAAALLRQMAKEVR
jgi:hypothetical protein